MDVGDDCLLVCWFVRSLVVGWMDERKEGERWMDG